MSNKRMILDSSYAELLINTTALFIKELRKQGFCREYKLIYKITKKKLYHGSELHIVFCKNSVKVLYNKNSLVFTYSKDFKNLIFNSATGKDINSKYFHNRNSCIETRLMDIIDVLTLCGLRVADLFVNYRDSLKQSYVQCNKLQLNFNINELE